MIALEKSVSARAHRIELALDTVLDAIGQPAAVMFCQNMKKHFGIEVNSVTSEKDLIYVESVLRLMFGAGAGALIRLLRNEMQK